MTVCSFLGLGVMGYPMAGHLSKKGFDIRVYNRSFEKAEQWMRNHKGQAFRTAKEAAQGADFVMACVGNDDDLRAVCLGEQGAFAGMKQGAIFIDHTTASAQVARSLGEIAQEKGLGFIDAPVSGGQAGAENGVLTVMCGGDEQHYLKAEPLIGSYARACRLMGALGSGQLTKMVNQICIAGLVQGLAEGMNFGQKAGLDMTAVLDVISKGAAGSWQMENRGATMCKGEYDFGFAVDWMRKDLGIIFDEAQRNGALLPVTALVDQFYAEVQQNGGRRLDTSSLMRRLNWKQGDQ